MRNDLGPAAVYGWLSLPGPEPNSAAELAGAAILLSSELAVTCAHVIRDHLGLAATPAAAPEAPVALRFETLDTKVEAVVVPEGWYPDNRGGPAGGLRDVAFLRLSAPVEAEELRHLGLAPWLPRGGRLALVYGAEPGYQGSGQSVPVKLAEHKNNRGLWQLDATSGVNFEVVRGFSGAPLLDEAGTVIWGMVVEVDAKGRPVAFAVGADLLYEACRHLPPKSSVVMHNTGRRPPDTDVPEEMRKLQEQILRANMELDAIRRELEVLQKRPGGAKA
jgi:hypothetical protein